MNVQITLENSSPFWMLGDPPNLIAHLSMDNMGPVVVDYSELEERFQKHVLLALRTGVIKTDISFESLHEACSASSVKVQQETKQAIKEQEDLSFFAKEEKKRKKEMDRVRFLLTRTVKGLSSALAKEKDSRFTRLLLVEEKKGRVRKTVVQLLENKIRVIEAALVRKIEAVKPKINYREETSVYDVIESDEEIIEISSETLAAIASGVC